MTTKTTTTVTHQDVHQVAISVEGTERFVEIEETASGFVALRGLGDQLDQQTMLALSSALRTWKYGVEHHGHALSEAEIIASRAWLAAHRGE